MERYHGTELATYFKKQLQPSCLLAIENGDTANAELEQPASSSDVKPDWAKQNASSRSTATAWVFAKRGDRLLCLALCLSPLTACM